MIQFTCECGKELRADEGHVGQEIRCPRCDSVRTIPGGPEARSQRSAEATHPDQARIGGPVSPHFSPTVSDRVKLSWNG